jgi:hypothetical protein
MKLDKIQTARQAAVQKISKVVKLELVGQYPIKPGDIILFNYRGTDSIYSKLQKDFQDTWDTEFELTHSALGFFPQQIRKHGTAINIPTVFEAKESMVVTPWVDYINDYKTDFWVYRFKGIDDQLLETIVSELWDETIGNPYAFLQILYWAREDFFKRNKIGQFLYPVFKWLHKGKEIEKWNNWFPDDNICSELCYVDMKRIAEQKNLQDLVAFMDMWDQNNISPVGLRKIINAHPQYFELIWKRESKIYRKVR